MSDLASKLAEFFEPNIAALLLSTTIPAVDILQSDSTDRLSFFGGTPVMSADIAWPRLGDVPLVRRWSEETNNNDLALHIDKAPPMSFLAQIDLAEVAQLGDVSSDLPDHGRLAFFCDMVAVYYGPDRDLCKVVWDRGEAPVARAEPEEIGDLIAAFGGGDTGGVDYEAFLRDLGGEDAVAAYRAELANTKHPYRADKTLVQFQQVERLPHANSIAFQTGPETLVTMQNVPDYDADMPFPDAYAELLGWDAPFQLLGAPHPVQDDPSFDAARVHLTGKLFSDGNPEEDAKVAAGAEDWVLLLQVPLAEWLGDPQTEGVIYFMIHRDDLAERRFARVLPVYQQT